MSRRLLLVPALALAVAAPASAHRDAPRRLQVVAREFSFTLSRPSLSSGKAVIELANFGQDPHDLHVRRISNGADVNLGVVAPGELGELALKLKAGKYELYCSLADHQALGMDVILKVKPSSD